MPKVDWPATPPKKILLATDLTGLSDRALDRAVQLADAWSAELVVVHAVEGAGLGLPDHDALPSWRRPPATTSFLEQQIREDVRGLCPRFKVLVEHGAAAQVILDAIERERCDLVVTCWSSGRSVRSSATNLLMRATAGRHAPPRETLRAPLMALLRDA